MNYSIYPNILTTKSDIIINGSQLRDIIMSDEMKRRVDIVRTASDAQRHELKKFLPNINVNGTFSHRADDGIKEYNGITALDFDHIPENEMQDIKDKLKQNPYTCFMFESPSGNGLKVLVRHDNTNPALHWNVYAQLIKEFEYIPYIDRGVHDLSRATYLSYDADCYINPNPAIFHFCYDSSFQRQQPKSKPASNRIKKGISPMTQGLVITNSLFQSVWKDKALMDYIDRNSWQQYPEDYQPGNRNNSLIKKSTLLCRCGVHYGLALWKLTYLYTRDPSCAVSEGDIEERVLYAYFNNAHLFGTTRQEWIDLKRSRREWYYNNRKNL